MNDEGKKLYVPAKTRSVDMLFKTMIPLIGLPSVTFSVLNMHRHEAYWGPDAHLWDPDRFLDERFTKTVVANPFIFLPFNAGPRIVRC